MRWGILLMVVVSFVSLAKAHAETIIVSREESVGLIRSIRLIITDDVTGRCWTNARSIENKSRLLFEQNDIPAYTEDLAIYSNFTPVLLIYVLGERISNGGCYGSIDFSIGTYRYNEFSDKGISYKVGNFAEIWSNGAVFYNGTNFNSQISDNVESTISGLIADILSMRRKESVKRILSSFPNAGLNPITQQEWDDMLKKARDEN